jgi:hypothetical protein
MENMPKEISRIRERLSAFIIQNDITLQDAATRIGWKKASSVYKFLAGKHIPNQRRLYRIKILLKEQTRGARASQPEARG